MTVLLWVLIIAPGPIVLMIWWVHRRQWRDRLGDWIFMLKGPTPRTIRRHDLDRAFPHQWGPVRNRLWWEIRTFPGTIYNAAADSYTITTFDQGDVGMFGPPTSPHGP